MTDGKDVQDRKSITRRTVVRAAVVVGLAAGGASAVAGCGGGTSAEQADRAGGGGANSAALARTTDVPVGGGVINQDAKVVVTQPAEGEFKAFDATCTHTKCPVTNVDGGTINCQCHGSRFSIEDGSVKQPPATEPLAEVKVKVEGGSVLRA